MKKVIIFDFDGTIADSSDVILKIFNRLAPKYGYRAISHESAQTLRDKEASEIFKSLKIPFYKIPFIIRRARQEFKKELHDTRPIHGIKSAIEELKAHDYTLGILTSNTRENVERFLVDHKLNAFDFIYSSNIFGKRKVLETILKEQKIKINQVIYIGDETRDIDAARAAGITIIAVSWGLNSSQILAAQNPDELIHTPHELLGAVRK